MPIAFDAREAFGGFSAMVETNPLLLVPFVLLLGAMALGPTLAAGWWARHYGWVALGLGGITVGIYVFGLHDLAAI